MILYKYYPINEYSFKSISINGLWCHSPHKMNDPFECLWRARRNYTKEEISLFKEAIKKSNDPKILKFSSIEDDKFSDFIDNLRKGLIQSFAFCSLSETFDNILMWSHYASSHEGFVIGINFPDMDYHFQKVRYRSALPKFNLVHYSDSLLNIKKPPKTIIRDFSIKSKDWKYEKEWRIWVNKPGYYKYERDQIKEIYFGINCSFETKALVLKLLAEIDDNYIHEFNEMEFKDNPVRLVK